MDRWALDPSSPFARGFVGVGVGIDVHNEQPDWRALLRSELPIDFFEVYTRGEVEWSKIVREEAEAAGMPLLYHDDALDPIVPDSPRPETLRSAVENMAACGAPWCVSELATRRLGTRYLDFFQPILLTDEAADAAAEVLKGLDEALPGRIVAENPPYQLPVGPRHVLEVVARVTERAGIPCVIDLSHLYSFQLCQGLGLLDGLDDFPLERVVELHVAGAVIDTQHGAPVYHDAHGGAEIPPPVLEMLAEVAPRCPELRAITIEVEDADLDRVTRQLEQTRAALGGSLVRVE